jgi:hypothetical protein
MIHSFCLTLQVLSQCLGKDRSEPSDLADRIYISSICRFHNKKASVPCIDTVTQKLPANESSMSRQFQYLVVCCIEILNSAIRYSTLLILLSTREPLKSRSMVKPAAPITKFPLNSTTAQYTIESAVRVKYLPTVRSSLHHDVVPRLRPDSMFSFEMIV